MRGRDPIQRAGLFRSVKLRFVAAQRLPRKPEAGTGSLPWPTVLVPIVIATLLCVYLFPLFSRSGEPCCRPLSVRLPVSRHLANLDFAPVITVERGEIILDGRRVGEASELNREGREVLSDLGRLLEERMESHRHLHPDRPRLTSIVLAADRETPYTLLRPILRVCFDHGLEVQLAVQRESFGGG